MVSERYFQGRSGKYTYLHLFLLLPLSSTTIAATKYGALQYVELPDLGDLIDHY